ncbi:capsular exopolysaccharide synthesis family protein [Pullulanibacillus pueri]|uniref:non-specific protein-tyrosine kinase n=1 Tax=Pullulanibacillus pueri TaxID=1437324 RepID=A0A8J3EMB0_9BACL|nr:CpsD/CapB family tyrosine-protein kinase [Pullulanibacillus pueri]MBM7681774.1 capsular exopolysaccharide synthesis family protein [Pullulanibacillus pueri]GGH84203.1 protein-tyrosine kinase [Pullulanibacillus pueri]
MKRSKKRQALNDLKQRSLITHNNPKSPISEQFRTIRTNIDFSLADRDIRTLAITSSGPAEGKSTITANLAVVMAQQGKRVLLVDADLRKPTVHYTFRMNNTTGLTNLLTKQMKVSEVIHKTDVENLYVLPSGPIPPNPAELLGSRNMYDTLQELNTVFDMVIFDTPPVLAVTDAQVLATICDGTLLVISSGSTEIDAAKEAKALLEKSKARLLGAVLNRKPTKRNNYYYYYGG